MDLSVSPSALIESLRSQHLTLSTAESCTGGNIAHRLTLVAGCSDVYLGGVVSYSNEVKMRLLGVQATTLDAHGAVSREVVEEMAIGACRATGADCAVATSGIAGPGGAVPGKPVGTVWIAACVRDKVIAQLHHFDGARHEVIEGATEAALAMLMQLASDECTKM